MKELRIEVKGNGDGDGGGTTSMPMGQREYRSFLCQVQKIWLGRAAKAKRGAIKALSRRFCLKESLLKKYRHCVNHATILHDNNGRPSALTPSAEKQLIKSVTNSHYQVRLEDFPKLMFEQVRESKKERGSLGATEGHISRTTMKKYVKKLKLNIKNAECTTKARYTACIEIRNAVTFAACCSNLSKNTHPALILNMDASQFTLGGNGHKLVKIITAGTPTSLKCLPVEGKYQNTMAFFIKYYLFISASGLIGHPVFVISDARMKKDAIDTYVIEGLGVGSGIEECGYVIFCKKRTGNIGMYSFINEHVMVPLIRSIRDKYDLPKERYPASVQMDGEQVQIDIYKHKTVLQMLKNEHINVIKSPSSTTEIFQPCDLGNCFKSAKAINKRIQDEDVDIDSPTFKLVSKMYEDHETYVNVTTRMPATHKRMGKYGLLRLQTSLNIALNSKLVRDSFSTSGISFFNLRKLCLQMKMEVSDADIQRIEANLPALEDLFEEFGEISDSKLEELGIVPPQQKTVDHLITTRRRAIELTHPAHRSNEDDKAKRKAQDAQNRSKRRRK